MSNDKLLRIRKLIDRAENSDSEAERELSMKMAMKLSADYNIDLAQARAAMTDAEKKYTLVKEDIPVGTPGSHGQRFRIMYCAHIAAAYGCKADIAHDASRIIVYGTQEQVDMIQEILVHLNIQFPQALKEAQKAHAKLNTHVRFNRKAFVEGYWASILDRVRKAQREAEQERAEQEAAAAQNGANKAESSAALAIITRKEEVQNFYQEKSNARGSFRAGNRSQNHTSRDSGIIAGRKVRLTPQKAVGRQYSLA